VAKKAAPRLLIEQTPVASLRPNSKNPRRHSDRQIKKLAYAIETYGFVSPVLIDRHDNVLAGHQT
jgi:ParB-like chromosome segregation protein Spo0J